MSDIVNSVGIRDYYHHPLDDATVKILGETAGKRI